MTAPDPRLGEIEARAQEFRPCQEDCGSTECQTERDALYLLAELRKARDALGRVEARAARWEEVAGAREQDNLVERDPEIWLENRTRSITLRANAHNIRAAVAAATGAGE